MTLLARVITAALLVSLAACDAEDEFKNDSDKKSVIISGTAATGAPISGNVVVKGSAGKETPLVVISAKGRYEVDVGELKAPYLIKAIDASSKEYFSLALEKGTANITPLTDLVVHSAFKSESALPTLPSIYNEWQTQSANVNSDKLSAAQKVVYKNFEGLMLLAGITKEKFALFMTQPFVTDSTGLDKALDKLTVTVTGSSITYQVAGEEAKTFNFNVDFNATNTTVTNIKVSDNGGWNLRLREYKNGNVDRSREVNFIGVPEPVDTAAIKKLYKKNVSFKLKDGDTITLTVISESANEKIYKIVEKNGTFEIRYTRQ